MLALLPPEAFSAHTPRGPRPLDRIQGVFASRLGGMTNPPTAQDLASAMASAAGGRPLTDTEELAAWTWLIECTTAELVTAWLDGAYAMRTLIAAMHCVGGATGHDEARTRALNTHCEFAWIERRDRADPAAEMKVMPRRRF